MLKENSLKPWKPTDPTSYHEALYAPMVSKATIKTIQ